MFEKNMLTFNPGWDQDAKPLDDFTDIRDLQKDAESTRATPSRRKPTKTTAGPASFMLIDPDGNPVLVDQHV
jgi:lactoylglutathione lyase